MDNYVKLILGRDLHHIANSLIIIVKPENIFTFLMNNNPVHSVAGEVS